MVGKVLVLLLAIGLLSGCDDRECLESHLELTWMPVYNATTGTTTLSPQWLPVCDEWTPRTLSEK